MSANLGANDLEIPRLVTFGETMVLMATTRVGPLSSVRSLRASIGGAESNVAIGVQRLGEPVAWFGGVGADELGDFVVRELLAERVMVRARTFPAPTAIMVRTSRSPSAFNVRYYRNDSAGAMLSAGDIDMQVVRSADVLHITGITLALGPSCADAVRQCIDVARAAGVLVSMDVNYRSALWSREQASRELLALIEYVDILFADEEEASLLLPRDAPETMARRLAASGPSQVLIKLGARGAIGFIDGETIKQPAPSVTVVDPVGAGDAFVAGYLAEVLKKQPGDKRLATAVAAGSFAVGVHGDCDGMPTATDLAYVLRDEPAIHR